MRVEGLIFAAVGRSDHDGIARFFADALGVELEVSGDVRRVLFANGSSLALVPPERHFRAPDGWRFELLDRNV